MPLRSALILLSAAAMLGSLVVAPPTGSGGVADALTASPAGTAAAAAPTSGGIDECLQRSAIVPVEVDAAGDADLARSAAMRTLQHALLSAGPEQLAAAQPRHGESGTIVGLDVIEAEPGAAAALTAEVIAALPAAAQALVQRSDVVVVAQAEQSLRALCAGLDRVLETTGAVDGVLSVAIDHRSASLRLGVAPSTLVRAAPGMRSSVDRLPDATLGEPATPAATDLLATLGLEDLAAPVEIVADRADVAASRLHDTTGYAGGSGIRIGADGGSVGLGCTAGFAVRTADRSPAVMSAGHCTGAAGGDGARVVSGHAAAMCGLGSGAPIGRVSQNLLAGSPWIDSMLVRTSAARPTIWLGTGCSGTAQAAVQGVGQIGVGQTVGFSGARQGERSAVRTGEPAGCYDFGFWACAIHRAISSAPATTEGYACLPGDSGGPAFQRRTGGGVLAVGIISASGYSIGLNRCSWVDMATALHASGATIMVDPSLTMAPPSRFAGGNRFETAALVSRHGFPSGSREVWIASGQTFADALGAGAAAAHRRAPLLLTASGALPPATRAELERLRPRAIVLTGSDATVSADVEAQLARIAPVTRLGGANRYETSALIAAHAFPDGARTAYVASGRVFADALASGPAAARAQAPVLLVNGMEDRAVDEATLDALDALGTARVVLVGGTPSVSAAQGDALRAGRIVSRIHGSDRYQTSARVNAVFGATPPALYVASGQDFPDALAAAAVAGARGAPLYLTPRSCLSPHIVGEHTRLGRPSVWVLGSSATLSAEVARYELC